MRKIKSMAEIQKLQRRNNIILGVVMIFLLVVSTAGYSIMSADSEDNEKVNELGFDFFRDQGLWKIVVGEEVFGFLNLPSEVSDIDVNISMQLGEYSRQPLYFVNLGDGVSEVLRNMQRYVLRYQESCLQQDGEGVAGGEGNESVDNETGCSGDFPIKDCSSNLIVFESGNETKVYSQDNCVFIVGDVIRGSDAFLYKLFGIQ
jgi:hypothetical protein